MCAPFWDVFPIRDAAKWGMIDGKSPPWYFAYPFPSISRILSGDEPCVYLVISDVWVPLSAKQSLSCVRLWAQDQHARLLCPSPTPRACSDLCPSSQWCHSTISSSVNPFSSLQSFPASGSFPMSQFFTSSGQSIGVSASASVLPINNQDWFPLEWTDWISLQSKGLSGDRVYYN